MPGWDTKIKSLIAGLAEDGLEESEWRYLNDRLYREYRSTVRLLIRLKFRDHPLTPEEEEDLLQEVFIANMLGLKTKPDMALRINPFSWFSFLVLRTMRQCAPRFLKVLNDFR